MELSKKIKLWRKKRSLSVRTVANELGIPESTYRGYEYGSKLPADLVPKLCSIFSINFEEFFSTMDEANKDKIQIWQKIDLMESCLKSFQAYIKESLKKE